MSSFSQIYMSSEFVRRMAEGMPDGEREAFLESLRTAVERYDSIATGALNGSSIIDALRAPQSGIPNQETRRLPRRR
jgi:hypothetical protein